jgi:hypothetical protein
MTVDPNLVDGLSSTETLAPNFESPETSSRLIAKVLTPALRLWLLTQVESVEQLQLKIQSGDRRLLSGCIEQVELAAEQVVYQGLRLSRIQLSASGIQVNLGQIIRGKPLRILAPITVTGDLQVSESDLNYSLQAPLLKDALLEFLTTFLSISAFSVSSNPTLEAREPQGLELDAPQICLNANQVLITGTLRAADILPRELGITTNLGLANHQTLQFTELAWLPNIPHQNRVPEVWDDVSIDLGPDVNFQQLALGDREIRCRACLTVQPSS